MFRRKMNKNQSRKNFRKGSRVKSRNFPKVMHRGGIRL